MSNRIIHLGFIHMSRWTAKSKLAASYYFDPKDESYNDKFAKKVRALDPDEVVLGVGNYTIKITYPLSVPFTSVVKVGSMGLTRRELVDLIVKAYRIVYKDANRSNKKFGVWGHCMSDLMLHTATVSKKNVINVDCDS